MLKRRSLFERCVTLPVGTWSIGRKIPIRSVDGHVRNLKTLHFERKETKFVGNETAIYGRNRSSVCLLFVKLARLCAVFSFIRLVTYARASWEHALSGSIEPGPHQRRQWEGANVRQKNPSPKICECLVVMPRSTARSCRSMSSYGRVLAASSRMLAARSEPVYFFFSFKPLSISL